MTTTLSDFFQTSTATNGTVTTRQPPSEATIEPITSITLRGFQLLITSILPIHYPNHFYSNLISNSDHRSISRIAAWDDNTVVGGICCRVEPIIPNPSPDLYNTPTPYQSELYIQALAVKSAYRQLGIASALLETVLEEAVSGKYGSVVSVYAHVWESNDEAAKFYGQRGFAIGEVQQGYYRKLSPSGARVVRRGLVEVAVRANGREKGKLGKGQEGEGR